MRSRKASHTERIIMLRERIEALFEATEIATTEQVADALYLSTAKARPVRAKLARYQIPVEHVGNNKWVLVR